MRNNHLASLVQSIDDTQQPPQQLPPKPAPTGPAPSFSSRAMETAGSVASGPASTSGPLSVTSQEEGTPEPDPNATYASVSSQIARIFLNFFTEI